MFHKLIEWIQIDVGEQLTRYVPKRNTLPMRRLKAADNEA